MEKKQSTKPNGKVTPMDIVVGENFRRLRLQKNITLESLARLINCSTQSLYNLEHGRTNLIKGLLADGLEAMGEDMISLFFPGTYRSTDNLALSGGVMRDGTPRATLTKESLDRTAALVESYRAREEREPPHTAIEHLTQENLTLREEIETIRQRAENDRRILHALTDTLKDLMEILSKPAEDK